MVPIKDRNPGFQIHMRSPCPDKETSIVLGREKVNGTCLDGGSYVRAGWGREKEGKKGGEKQLK